MSSFYSLFKQFKIVCLVLRPVLLSAATYENRFLCVHNTCMQYIKSKSVIHDTMCVRIICHCTAFIGMFYGFLSAMHIIWTISVSCVCVCVLCKSEISHSSNEYLQIFDYYNIKCCKMIYTIVLRIQCYASNIQNKNILHFLILSSNFK